MPTVAQCFPVIAGGSGHWTGTYTHIDLAGAILDQYRVGTVRNFQKTAAPTSA